MEEDEIDQTVRLSSTQILEYFATPEAVIEDLDTALDFAQGDVLTQGKEEYRILVIVRR